MEEATVERKRAMVRSGELELEKGIALQEIGEFGFGYVGFVMYDLIGNEGGGVEGSMWGFYPTAAVVAGSALLLLLVL